MNEGKIHDALQRALMTAFKDEAEYIQQRREQAIKRMGDRWLLAVKRGRKA